MSLLKTFCNVLSDFFLETNKIIISSQCAFDLRVCEQIIVMAVVPELMFHNQSCSWNVHVIELCLTVVWQLMKSSANNLYSVLPITWFQAMRDIIVHRKYSRAKNSMWCLSRYFCKTQKCFKFISVLVLYPDILNSNIHFILDKVIVVFEFLKSGCNMWIYLVSELWNWIRIL
jgi:hypothetical protein